MAKKLRYLNTNCLGNALTVNSSNSFNAKFVHNSYIQLYKDTDYIFLGHRDRFKDSKCFELYSVSSVNIQNNTTGTIRIGQNLVYNQTANIWVSQVSYDFANKKYTVILSNHKQYESASNTTIGQFTNKWVIALSDTGVPTLYNMSKEIGLTQVANSTHTFDEFVYIGAIRIINNTSRGLEPSTNPSYLPIFTIHWRSSSDISTSDNITHFFRLCEGIGNNYVYDVKSDIIGRVYTASQSNSWKFDGFKTAYNTLDGFTCDENFLQYSERIPLGKELCVYQSDFTKTIDGWYYTNPYTEPSYSSTKNQLNLVNTNYTLSSPETWMLNTISIQTPNINISSKQYGRKFRVKFNLKNTCSTTITHIGICLGSNVVSKGLGGKYIDVTSESIGINSMKNVDVELDIPEILTYDSTIFKIYFEFASNTTEAHPLKCDISNVQLFQIDNLQENLVTANGKNNSESNIDFTCNVSNSATQNYIPELRMLPAIPGQNAIYYIPPYTNPDPAMGATTDGGWNITSKPSSNVIKGNWITSSSYTAYLKNHETTDDLPEGVTSAIDIKTTRSIGYSSGGNFFHDNNWTNINPFISRFINKFKIRYSIWYRVNPSRTVTTSGSYQLTLGVFYNKIEYITAFPDTDWHKLEGEAIVDLTQCNTAKLADSSTGTNDHAIALSWQTTDTSVDYAGTIADFQYTLEMVEDTFSPVICKLDPETKSLSNILVYNNHQRDINLLRAKNHLTHF